MKKNKIYKDKEDLYLTKEKLLEKNHNKEELNMILMDLIKYVPQETIETVTDFARATLLLGFEKTESCFRNFVWKYIIMVVLKKSLDINEKIEFIKKEAQMQIINLVKYNLNQSTLSNTKTNI